MAKEISSFPTWATLASRSSGQMGVFVGAWSEKGSSSRIGANRTRTRLTPRVSLPNTESPPDVVPGAMFFG
jgi:hypothetical protein